MPSEQWADLHFWVPSITVLYKLKITGYKFPLTRQFFCANIYCTAREERTGIAKCIFIDVEEITVKIQLCQWPLKHYIGKESIIYVTLPFVIWKNNCIYFCPPLLMNCEMQILAGFAGSLYNIHSSLLGEKSMVFLKLKAFYFLAMQFWTVIQTIPKVKRTEKNYQQLAFLCFQWRTVWT